MARPCGTSTLGALRRLLRTVGTEARAIVEARIRFLRGPRR